MVPEHRGLATPLLTWGKGNACSTTAHMLEDQTLKTNALILHPCLNLHPLCRNACEGGNLLRSWLWQATVTPSETQPQDGVLLPALPWTPAVCSKVRGRGASLS